MWNEKMQGKWQQQKKTDDTKETDTAHRALTTKSTDERFESRDVHGVVATHCSVSESLILEWHSLATRNRWIIFHSFICASDNGDNGGNCEWLVITCYIIHSALCLLKALSTYKSMHFILSFTLNLFCHHFGTFCTSRPRPSCLRSHSLEITTKIFRNRKLLRRCRFCLFVLFSRSSRIGWSVWSAGVRIIW